MFPTDEAVPEGFKNDESDRTQLRATKTDRDRKVGATLAPKVLKSRFVLEEQLGSGGMGSVYRAKDLRKVEAQDRNPYLAIKVLNADFREHPDAFIALQREAAKSQSLSHPNIVKIFDFDKEGDVPFMTMELLRGSELSELLRQYPQGLPETLAWPVIQNFCSALRHAHAEGVIHADIKPGNLFVTHAGQLKIFDFGLARAVQANFSQGVMQTRSDVEDYVFDAAALGALTPAFASKAMLMGASPNAADDVFAAALVIYQILTGKHPYNRIPADKIDTRATVPERPRQLTSRQWRALSGALALEEADRVASVADLEAALFEKSPWPMRLLAIGLGCIAITLWFFNLQKDDEIRVVQQQAVQAGRVEAGVDRIVELIEAPTFDTVWEQRIDDELGRLALLKDSARVHGNAMAQVSSLYVGRVLETQDLQSAVKLAERGERYGVMDAAWQSISERLQIQLDEELAKGVVNERQISIAEELLEAIASIANRSTSSRNKHALALAQLATNSNYLVFLETDVTAVSEPLANRIFGILEDREFDFDRVTAAREAMASQAESFAEELERDQARTEVANFGDRFVEQGCPVDRLSALQNAHAKLRASEDVSKSALAARTDRLLADCVSGLVAIDPDAAASLRQESLAVFGALPRTSAVLIDPCDRQYLVGAGSRGGRAGTCVDDVRGAPEMVVVPFKASALAVTRYEISGAEYSEFCKRTGRSGCTDADELKPIANVSVENAQDYASWLSAVSGFNYRLPSYEEWLAFTASEGAEPDANRNCLVSVGGVTRGGSPVRTTVGAPNAFGVVNSLGNLAEWVITTEGLFSVGGHFNDELDRCIASTKVASTGAPSATQGIRLVRELSARWKGGEQ